MKTPQDVFGSTPTNPVHLAEIEAWIDGHLERGAAEQPRGSIISIRRDDPEIRPAWTSDEVQLVCDRYAANGWGIDYPIGESIPGVVEASPMILRFWPRRFLW